MKCFFVTDLHGHTSRYDKLFNLIYEESPETVLIGGDLFPSFTRKTDTQNIYEDFFEGYLIKKLNSLRKKMPDAYPDIFLILGNDDLKAEEEKIKALEVTGLYKYIHSLKVTKGGYDFYGYSYVPPSPFLLKDWEKYDISRYVDPGCVSPEEGKRSVSEDSHEVRYATIKDDFEKLFEGNDFSKTIVLFHSPPYKTNLDRLDNDGKFIDHVPLDNYAGSIAIRKFIEEKQPLATLHGHIHESARLTGEWKDKIGNTFCFSAAHDGPELALIKFDAENPESAVRELV
ncbi:MAG: metallophosphoesterase [Bacteroidetes bacterium]|nr:metallophosphoesterase [Bacteroidota bacterium]